jgi:Phage capsid family
MTEELAKTELNEHVVETPPDPGGIRFTRMVKCLAVAQGDLKEAAQRAKMRYSQDPKLVQTLQNAVQFGEVFEITVWHGNKLCGDKRIFEDFVRYVNDRTALARASAVVQIPFRTAVLDEKTGDRVTLPPRKFTAMVTVTEDLLRDSSPSADEYVRDAMANAIAKKIDDAFRAEIGHPDTPCYVADSGGILVDAASKLSMKHFEDDLVVIKVQRFLNWVRR